MTVAGGLPVVALDTAAPVSLAGGLPGSCLDWVFSARPWREMMQ